MASRQTLMSFQHFLSMLPTAPSLLIAKQAISPSPCSTSGLHSRWNIGKGGEQKVGIERWNAEELGGSKCKTEEVKIMSKGRSWWRLRKPLWCMTEDMRGDRQFVRRLLQGSSWACSCCLTKSHATVELYLIKKKKGHNQRCEADEVSAETEA